MLVNFVNLKQFMIFDQDIFANSKLKLIHDLTVSPQLCLYLHGFRWNQIFEQGQSLISLGSYYCLTEYCLLLSPGV